MLEKPPQVFSGSADVPIGIYIDKLRSKTIVDSLQFTVYIFFNSWAASF
jgi:hypothetical protein